MQEHTRQGSAAITLSQQFQQACPCARAVQLRQAIMPKGRPQMHLQQDLLQEVLLQVHLGAAFRHDRLAQLHGAGAWARLLELLRQRDRCGTLPRVLLHAWNGSHELAREFLSLGALFSVGVRELSHPKAAERYARIPADRLFAESDDAPESFPRAVGMLTMLRGDIGMH